MAAALAFVPQNLQANAAAFYSTCVRRTPLESYRLC